MIFHYRCLVNRIQLTILHLHLHPMTEFFMKQNALLEVFILKFYLLSKYLT